MSKEDQKIIVVERDLLFGKDIFQGFRPHKEVDYESRILSNLKIMKRGLAEKDPTHKQPIGYTIVGNKERGEIFAYQRSSKDKDYGEKRLQGKWSWGVGGHIEPLDTQNGNPIRESILREVLREEIEVKGNVKNPVALGYINDDSNSVGEVHFGIMYFMDTDGIVKPKDSEMSSGKLIKINELENICSNPNYNVETWSKIALGALKNYF